MAFVGILLMSGIGMIAVEAVGYQRGGYNSAFWKLPLDDKLENIQLGDLGYTLAYDSRDDPFSTNSGTYLALETQLFTEALASDANFAKWFFSGSRTRTFDNGQTLAAALRLGLARPYGGTTVVPLSERFFAGGDSTLRGFPRDEVGPIGSGGFRLGFGIAHKAAIARRHAEFMALAHRRKKNVPPGYKKKRIGDYDLLIKLGEYISPYTQSATSAATVQLSIPIAAVGGTVSLAKPLTLRLLLTSLAIPDGIALMILEKQHPKGV